MDMLESCRTSDVSAGPPVGRDFIARCPPGRIKRALPHDLPVGSRLGLSADFSLSGWLRSPALVLRKASLREVLGMLERPGHVEQIPTMEADASLGFSGMA